MWLAWQVKILVVFDPWSLFQMLLFKAGTLHREERLVQMQFSESI